MIIANRILPDYRDAASAALHAACAVRSALHHSFTGRTYTAKHLERQFTAKSDPWDLEGSETGLERFPKTWQLVPDRPYSRILEIGCAEGHFTDQIVKRFPDADVVAVDFVPLAVERTRARCGDRPRVTVEHFDIAAKSLPGAFDLIFCMGVLEYGPTFLQLNRVRDHILSGLAPGGYLMLQSCTVPTVFDNQGWARIFGYGARALHDRFVHGDVVHVADAMVCGDWCMATLLVRSA